MSHSLPNPGEVMRNIAFNLRMDGYLYVEGLEFQNLLTRRSILDLSYERRTYFTAESLKRVMSDAGSERDVARSGEPQTGALCSATCLTGRLY